LIEQRQYLELIAVTDVTSSFYIKTFFSGYFFTQIYIFVSIMAGCTLSNHHHDSVSDTDGSNDNDRFDHHHQQQKQQQQQQQRSRTVPPLQTTTTTKRWSVQTQPDMPQQLHQPLHSPQWRYMKFQDRTDHTGGINSSSRANNYQYCHRLRVPVHFDRGHWMIRSVLSRLLRLVKSIFSKASTTAASGGGGGGLIKNRPKHYIDNPTVSLYTHWLPILLVGVAVVQASWIDPDTPEQYYTTKPLTTGDQREFQLVRYFSSMIFFW
jgi:hypothetical protein